MAKVKSLQAKKIINKPADLTHKYYEPERLVAKWQKEGKSSDEIREGLIKYVTDERQKCFDDPIYFANSYGFIIGHGATGIIPFDADTYQVDILKGVRHDKYSIAVKSRQLGVSTVVMFYCLWFSIFSQGKKTLVVAHKREGAEEFIAKLKTAYEFLPEWLKPSCTLYSKSTVEFDTKSSIKAMTSNPNAARSFSATLFVLDEAAFIEDCDEVVRAILPTVAAADGKLIAISSPNGNSDLNWFYKTYTYAAAKLNPWTAYNLPYTVSKVFMSNPKFRDDQIRVDNGNVDKFEVEFNCFPAGTPVLTATGSVSIENIRVNDAVFSHSGRLRKVTAINNKPYVGKLYKISSYGSAEPILCTPEHPIRTYNKHTQKYTWTAAKDLTKTDLVVFPKMSLSTFKPISDELCKLLAWYITEGCIAKNSIIFSLSNEVKERDHVLSLLDKLNISYSVGQGTGWRVSVNNVKLVDFFYNACGSLAENKKIPFDLISGNEELFFNELILGDGCHSIYKGYEKYCYTTISKSLAYQVQLLANSINKYTAGISIVAPHLTTIEDRVVICSERFVVNIGIKENLAAKSRKLVNLRHSVSAIIKGIDTIDFSGLVYNFSVAYDESYIVAGRAVHNCNFNVNLASLFSPNVLKAFKVDTNILNKQLGGITYEDTLFIWKLAEAGKKYKIGVDCSSNKASAKDFTSFEVIDEETQEQMAEYIGKLPTELLVEILIKTAKHYNTAELIIEENSYSQLVIYLLEQKNYKNLWYADNKTTPGFNTNRNSRVLLLEKLILFYNNLHGISKLKSARLKVQMENFSAGQVYADGSKKFEASKGNDDAILALALAVVTLTPKEYFHRPELEDGSSTLMMSTENMKLTGEYNEEYLEHFSILMGISKASLASRLKLYHDIKSGMYDGSGLDDLNFVHPVEEWERAQAAADFLGMKNTQMLSDTQYADVKKATLPFGEQYAMDDIFSDDLPAIYQAHKNFLYGNRNTKPTFW
jgi:hypothetical protein